MQSQTQINSIHQLFEFQALQTPDAVAVVFADQHLTYRELNERSNQLAHYLQTLGVKPEVLVGICVDRSLEMIVGLLGILKAGGAYVPLDPSYPQERLAFMLEDSQLSVLLTEQNQLEKLPQHSAHIVNLDVDWQTIIQYSTHSPNSGVQPNNLAYAIYTSGSTGKPKGVAIEHQGAINTILDINQRFNVSSQDRALAVCSLNFDLSVYDIFGLLAAGGTIVVPKPASTLNPGDWLDLMVQQQVTIWNSAPPVMQMFVGHLTERTRTFPSSLRLVLLSGDWIPLTLPNVIRQLKDGTTEVEIISLGGATEASIWSIFYSIKAIDPTWKSIPYGQPLTNQQFYVLDEHLKPVPTGTIGELYIGGEGVARGYLNRPDLNAVKFLSNSFSNAPAARLYRTGDLGRYMPDGNIEFLGRIDHQIKIRGFRVELGEIETLIGEHPMVSQVLMVARDRVPGDKQLVAYIVLNASERSSQQPIARILRSFLQQKLPDYMIPAAFVVLESFPLTPNGKIDRRALPIPQWTLREQGSYIVPSTPIEIQLTEIWSRLLRVEQIGIHDNFCELGGHSLLAVQLIYHVNAAFQLELSLQSFLDNPTVAGLAQSIEAIRLGEFNSIVADDPATDITLDPTIYPENSLAEPVLNLFLTGATGFLGTFLLYELLQQTRSDVYCLVRATSLEEGRIRIQNQLKHYQLWEESLNTRIIPVLGDLSQPLMGIDAQQFSRLAEKLDIIYHCGAWVNVIYPYSALKAANVTGTEEVLRLASLTKIKPVHFISTVDVFPFTNRDGIKVVGEQDATGPLNYLCNGYAQSKYIAEQLVLAAHSRGLPVSIYRPSNITGDSKTGRCQFSDFFNKMLKGCIQMEAAPRLEAMLNLIPVDCASKAIVHLSRRHEPNGRAFHIVNSESISWDNLVAWMNQSGYPVQSISYEAWYSKLLNLTADNSHQASACVSENVLVPLSSLFTNQNFVQKSLGVFRFECSHTLDAFDDPSLAYLSRTDELLNSHFSYLNESGFLPSSFYSHKVQVPVLEEVGAI